MNKLSSDNFLWERITQNDESAFNVIFNKYFHSLCSFCYSIVGEIVVTEEIVSDVFVKLWLNRHVIQIKSGLKPYIYQAVKNTAINYLRQKKTMVNIENVSETELVSLHKADQRLDNEEILMELNHILETLTPQQNLIFRMYKLEGFSQEEIAEILCLTKKTVQNHICLAIKSLTKKYKFKECEFGH